MAFDNKQGGIDMATRAPKLSEAIELGLRHPALIVECDHCKRSIDAIHGFWLEEFNNGNLYNPPVLCWRCKEEEQ